MCRKPNKGMTIAEICIVLAVLSVVSLSIVSFAAMATGRGATSTDKLKVMQDIELLETMVDNWFNEVYSTENRPGINGENTSSLIIGDKSLSWANGNLIVKFSDEDVRTYRFETVTELTFEKMSQGDDDIDDIYFCTVTYVYRRGQNKEQPETYTFCINPRVGESITK